MNTNCYKLLQQIKSHAKSKLITWW